MDFWGQKGYDGVFRRTLARVPDRWKCNRSRPLRGIGWEVMELTEGVVEKFDFE
jgi:hypothetical protein